MSSVLRIGDRVIEADTVLSLLVDYQMMPKLVREILIDQAIAGVEVTPQDKETALQQFCQQQQITNLAELQNWLGQQGLTQEQLEKLVVRNLKLEKFKRDTWGSQVESLFLQRKSQMDRVVYSLIRLQDAHTAQELFFRIQEGEQSFTDLAKTYSQGPEAQTGGLVGPVEIQTLHPSLAQILRLSHPGKLSPPCQIGEWIVLVRLEKLLPAQLDEATHQRLLNECFNNWMQQQIQSASLELTDSSTSSTAVVS